MIVTKLRLEWTFESFFADGGTTHFIDRLASALGIHASRIKVVSILQGSIIIEFIITNGVDEDEIPM